MHQKPYTERHFETMTGLRLCQMISQLEIERDNRSQEVPIMAYSPFQQEINQHLIVWKRFEKQMGCKRPKLCARGFLLNHCKQNDP